MSKIIRTVLATGFAAASLAVPTAAFADAPDNWGQEVKSCNESNCYPGGTSRGEYVRDQARDSEGPGYGWEIQNLAKPGNRR